MVTYEEVSATASRAADFAVGKMDEEGRLGAARDWCFAYFKVPCCLPANGRHVHAARGVRWMYKRFLRDGDFSGAPGDATYGRFHFYRDAWIVSGLQQMGEYGAARATSDVLLDALHPQSGGLTDEDPRRESSRTVEFGGSCAAANAFLACGQIDRAIRVGEFLLTHLREQATADMFVTRVDWDGKLVNPADYAGPERIYTVVDIGKPGQAFWYFGFAMRVSARLYDATQDSRWLELGRLAMAMLDRCGAHVYTSITNSKVGWGSADMHRVTGEHQYKAMALRIMRWLVDNQTNEGTWIRKPGATFAEQTLESSLEVAMERGYTLREMQRSLTLAGHSWQVQ